MSPSRGSNAPATSDPPSTLADTSHRQTTERSKRRFRHRTAYARERDVFRQLQPWEVTFSPAALYRDPWPEIPSPNPPVPAQPCPDTALSAIAQLCALRLHARRCLVLLTCRDREFVLSDMTRTSSLQYDSYEDPLDAPWLGTCSFPRSASINDGVIDEWQKARDVREVPGEVDHYYTQGVSPHFHIISDLRHNSRYQDIVMTRNAPWARFCLSVPLRGGNGSVIGSICVLDDKPRFGVGAMEMNLVEDLADTLVQHLEAVRVGVQQQRGDRMLQAIKTFNSGEDSLRGWWQIADDAHALNMGRHVDPGTIHDRQFREDAQFGVRSARTLSAKTDNRGFPTKLGSRAESAVQASDHDAWEPSRAQATKRSGPRRLADRKMGKEPEFNDGFDLATACVEAYDRGANLIREALGLDGVIIVNTGTSGKHSASETSDRSSNSTQEGESSGSGREGVRLCEVFASSSRLASTVSDSGTDEHQFELTEASLKRLLKCYPDGNLFHISGDGTVHTSSGDSQSPTDTNKNDPARRRRSRDDQIVQRALKSARSVAFYPIWDDATERHRACVFAYSFGEQQYREKGEDLAYLSAFGHSLSATLLHLESVAADRAKGTFISSISHELRSPLHGIMAGVEFLQDSDLTKYQSGMCDTISMAGQALLDTVNHILDYSKISSHVRAERQGANVEDVERSSENAEDAGLISHVDLAQLTEDVAEITIMAHRAQQKSSSATVPQWTAGSRQPTSYTADVSVSMDIDHTPYWHLETRPGGWTRIITNLLTNALKYTKKGHINIRLQAGDLERDTNGLEMRPVQLTVEDTGVGMSENFVQHGAWVPFKQEDPHSVGTGLGLSIVHEIAKGMGAKVVLASRLGKGTKVEVRFLGKFVSKPTSTPHMPRIQHLSMISTSPKSEDVPVDGTDNLSTDVLNEWSVAASVRQTAQNWLNCSVSTRSSGNGIEQHSLCAITQLELEEWHKQRPDRLAALMSHLEAMNSRLLVLAKAVGSTSVDTDCVHASKLTFLQQPIGPRKLLKAITDGDNNQEQGQPRDRSWPISSPGKLDPGDEKRSLRGKGKAASRHPPVQNNAKRTLPRRVKETGHSPTNSDSKSSAARYETPSTSSEDADSEQEVQHGSSTKHDAEDTDDRMALLVEDNDVNMKLLIALMKKLKLKYRCAVHGKEAYDMYRDRPAGYFLILMDISMPVMDGFTATSKIRALETKQRLPRTRIVALTGVTNEPAKRQAFDAGVDEYYAKPVRMKELRELVDRTQQSGQSSRGTSQTET